jgi:hypothetical protein
VTPLAASAEPLVLEVTLTGPARYHADVGAGCEVSGAVARCGFEQPARGGSVPPIELAIDGVGPGAEATARILRGATVEAVLAEPVPLTPFESGLTIDQAAWTPGERGAGTLALTVAQSATSDASGLSVAVNVTGGVRLDQSGSGAACTEAGSSAGSSAGRITCDVPTVPGGGAVTVEVALTVTGAGQKAEAMALLHGETEIASLDQVVDLSPE